MIGKISQSLPLARGDRVMCVRSVSEVCPKCNKNRFQISAPVTWSLSLDITPRATMTTF